MVYNAMEASEYKYKVETLDAVCSDIGLVLEGKETHRAVPQYMIDLYRKALGYIGIIGIGEFARDRFESPARKKKTRSVNEPLFQYLRFDFGKTQKKFQKAAIRIGEGKPVDKDLTERVLGVFKANRGFWRTQLMCQEAQHITPAILNLEINI